MKSRGSSLILVALILLSANAIADSVRREGDGDRAQLMLRQLTQAKAKLEADNAKLAAEVQDLKDRLAKSEKTLNETSKNLDRSSASNDKLVARVREDNDKLVALMERYRDAVQLVRMEKANVEHLKLAVQERNEWIDKCKANNDAMYKLNQELIDRYQHKGFWQTVTQAEPLTGIGEVHVETIAEEYRYKLDDLQVARFKAKESEAKDAN